MNIKFGDGVGTDLLWLGGVDDHEPLPRRLLLALGVGRPRVHHRAVAAGRPAEEEGGTQF